ncbi:MAG: hypothetical protein IJ705_09535 [Oscillospiraceae bacterium]|nr:hypothetical protein [Oscillospiraceae bacterium]
MKYNAAEEWRVEGVRRFGRNIRKWRFKCPMCGHVASVQDFIDAGANSAECAYQECLGRYTGKGAPKEGDSTGCDWAAYGLFGIPKEHDVIVLESGVEMHVYPFAEAAEDAGGTETEPK